MNTIIAGWVEDQFQTAIKLRIEGRSRQCPKIDVTGEFEPLFSSRLYPVTRSMFTTRMRRQ